MAEDEIDGRAAEVMTGQTDGIECGRQLAMDAVLLHLAEQRAAAGSLVARRRRWKVAFLSGAALAAAAAVVLVANGLGILGGLLPVEPLRAEVVAMSGSAGLQSGPQTTPLAVGASVGQGNGILVHSGGSVDLKLADGSRLKLGAMSMVRFEGADRKGPRVRIDSGMLIAEMNKQRLPCRLFTPHAEAKVMGTRLRLMVGPQATRLDVFEGLVCMIESATGRSDDITGGNYALVAPQSQPSMVKRTIPKLSPQYGGVFFEEYAGLYKTKGFALEVLPFEDGDDLWCRSPAQLLETSRGWGGDIDPVTNAINFKGRTIETLKLSNLTSSNRFFAVYSGWVGDDAFAIRATAYKGQTISSKPWYFNFNDHSGFLPTPRPEKAVPPQGPSHINQDEICIMITFRYLLVGQLPNGTPLYECRSDVNGRLGGMEWNEGMPAGFDFGFQNREFDLADIRVWRMNLPDAGK